MLNCKAWALNPEGIQTENRPQGNSLTRGRREGKTCPLGGNDWHKHRCVHPCMLELWGMGGPGEDDHSAHGGRQGTRVILPPYKQCRDTLKIFSVNVDFFFLPTRMLSVYKNYPEVTFSLILKVKIFKYLSRNSNSYLPLKNSNATYRTYSTSANVTILNGILQILLS